VSQKRVERKRILTRYIILLGIGDYFANIEWISSIIGIFFYFLFSASCVWLNKESSNAVAKMP
jgi:hypothetical protein